MHIYFSAIGGAGIGPLAELAFQAGYEVSGSDKQNSSYITALKKAGITDIYIDQSAENIARVNERHPIDWLVYSSAIIFEAKPSEELEFAIQNNIKSSKRDELINQIVKDKGLKMIAIAGTHGKTTTTAMIIWLGKQLGLPLSYLLPAKTSFSPMGMYTQGSQYLVIEADEFDRNFLSFTPWLSVISGVSWDHHEIFPTRENYQQAFKDFISQSQHTLIWQEDADYLNIDKSIGSVSIQDSSNIPLKHIRLKGLYNRLDGWLAIQALLKISDSDPNKLIDRLNHFPGLARRMERIIPNLYSDYAHTPEKIRGAMSVAKEMAKETGQNIVVVYEPLTDRRQHYIINNYGNCFEGASQVYWLPSYLARENLKQRIIPPAELIAHLSDPSIAQPNEKGEGLARTIESHLAKGEMVICIAGGGAGSLDDWIRENFTN